MYINKINEFLIISIEILSNLTQPLVSQSKMGSIQNTELSTAQIYLNSKDI